MPSSKADASPRLGWDLEELQILSALGFGPDSVLLNDPKLFIDSAFLAALQRELSEELGAEQADRALFHIGMIHGLRDASRIGDTPLDGSESPHPRSCLPVAMRFGSHQTSGGLLEVAGTWMDHFEANARLSDLGESPHPACSLSSGYTSGWLSGTLDRDVVAVEKTCKASGDTCCSFVARDETSWRDRSDVYDTQRLPVAALRAVADDIEGRQTPQCLQSTDISLVAQMPTEFDREELAVHVWGPVMVVPFSGVESTLETIELMSHDEPTRKIRVVVLDLGGAIIDEGFDGAALENLIQQIQAREAEVILSGISPLSKDVVAELQANQLLSRKDLPEAIAYAFQIAEAQRHLL